MIGRRLLTRMTRLGLSMYAAIWCMSFTVCAYDDPIADMAVGNKVALLMEAAEDGANADIAPGEEDLADPSGGDALAEEPDVLGVEDPEDAGSDGAATEGVDDLYGEEEALLDDDVIDTGSEDASGTIMEVSEPELDFNITSLTITNTNKEYKFKLIGTEALENIDPGDTNYEIKGLSDSEKEGINLTLDDDENLVISFNESWDQLSYHKFQVIDTFTYEEEEYNASMDVVVYVPVEETILRADVDEVFLCNGSDFTIPDYDASQIMTLTLLDNATGSKLNASRISWNVTDVDTGESIDYEDDAGTVLLLDHDLEPDGSKNLIFGDGFIGGNYSVSVSYNNTFIDAEGNNETLDPAEASCKVEAFMPQEDVDVTGITIDKEYLTINDINPTYNFAVESTNGATIDTSKLEYKISPTGDPEDLHQFYEGLNLTKSKDGIGQLSFHYTWNQARCSSFYVYAIYTNGSDVKLYDSCKVVVYVPIKGITFVNGDFIVGNEINLGKISQEDNISLGMNITDDDWRIFLNPERIVWKFYNVTDDKLIFYSDIEREAFSCKISDSTLYATTNIPMYLDPGKYALRPVYNNTYINASNEYVHARDVNATCYFEVKKPYKYNVIGIEPSEKELMLCDGANMTAAIKSAGIKTGDTISSITTDELDPEKLVWGLTEVDSDEFISSPYIKLNPSNYTCGLEVYKYTEPYELDLVVRYYNDKDPADPESPYAEGRMRLIHEEVAYPDLEAHLSEKTLKVQVYNAKNEVPLTIRTSDLADNRYLYYKLTDVGITDTELAQYVDISVSEDGRSINFKAKSSVLDLPAKELTALLKKKFKTQITVTPTVDGYKYKPLMTAENLTISFGGVKPTAKNIKVNGTLEFDSFYQGEIKEVSFTGGKVAQLIPVNASALTKLGFALVGGTRVQTIGELPATKKGSFKAIAILDDEENYNLPENYNIIVTVKYVVTNSAPKFTSDISQILLNPSTSDQQTVDFRLVGSLDDYTYIGYKITDSKGNDANSEFTLPNPRYHYGDETGSFTVKVNENTKPGQTYKLHLFALNTRNGRRGAEKVFTVKTVASSGAGKMGITLKATGSIDASLPTQLLNLTYTGKNINLYGRGYPNVTVSLKDGTNISKYFAFSVDSAKSTLMIGQDQDPELGLGDFPLYEADLAGQAIDITVGYQVSGTETINATYSTKIGSSKVTPKLGLTKVNINPDYLSPDFGTYYEGTRVDIPITNLPGGFYSYDVVLDYGQRENAPFTYKFIKGEDGASDIVQVIPNISEMSSMYGKSCAVKIAPKIPGEKGAVATCKISVLNPVTKKGGITAKAKGSIDAVKDGTSANVTITLKNVYLDDTDSKAFGWTEIKAKNGTDCSDMFFNYTDNKAGTIRFVRRNGKNLEAGTYTACVYANIIDSEGHNAKLTTTVKIKVTRGKTATTVKPSPVKMVNRDYARTATVSIAPKYTGFNKIRDVKITDTNADKMGIYNISEGTYMLVFDDSYIEGSIVNKIFKVITKHVSRTVKLEVYYEGSTKPDKVNAKVRINP